MKYSKQWGLATAAALALMLSVVSGASATAVEVGGVPKNAKVGITATLKSGTSLVLKNTGGTVATTCTASHVRGSTESPYSGTTVGGPLSSLSFSSCSKGLITVDAPGVLRIERIGSTTNGTVISEGAEVTVPSSFGALTCKTGTGTDIGTLTGVASGQAMMDINGILNCGIVPSAIWEGSYTVTSPSGLGVTGEVAPSTTLEVAGIPKKESVGFTASLKAGTAETWTTTGELPLNACTGSHLAGSTESPYSGFEVGGPLSSLSFSKCSLEPIEVVKAGSLKVSYTSGTNGTVRSAGAELKVPSPLGSLTCTTGTGTDIGTLTGVKEGHATLDINAVINCGSQPSVVWKGSYTITTPTGLGVTAEVVEEEEVPAPATTLEVGGTPKTESVEITASLKSGTSTTLKTTGGLFGNTCTESHLKGSTTSPYSGATVGGPLSSLSFSGCTEEKFKVDEAGSLSIEWILGTTNGTVRSSGAKLTVPSPFGSLTCTTGTGSDIGALIGVKEGHATLDLNQAINCGIIPSAVWEGSYTITSPTGLGVTG